MNRFFVKQDSIKGERIVIEGADAHHIHDVLRLRKGEMISVSTGDGVEYTAGIEESSSEKVEAVISDMNRSASELPVRIKLYQCVPKADKLETIIQKSVELGVCEIIPVISSRCISRPDRSKAGRKLERWNAIARSAAEQSRRSVIPVVRAPVGFEEALLDAGDCSARIMAYEEAGDIAGSREIINAAAAGKDAALLTGPEGGFTKEEAEAAAEAGFSLITLGRRILRAETAPLTLLSVIMFASEE